MATVEELQKIDRARQEHFDELHSKELIGISRNYTADEQADVCKVMKSAIMLEEIERRNKTLDEIFLDLMTLLSSTFGFQYTIDNPLGLVDKEALLAKIRKVVKVSNE